MYDSDWYCVIIGLSIDRPSSSRVTSDIC
jgi:hypothetical protein